MRIRFLLLAVGLALSACFPYPDSVAIYGAHSYNCCAEIVGETSWHPGRYVTLHWGPTPPGQTTDPTRHPIVLSLSLTGPFANVETLKQAISQGSKPAGVRTITAAPVAANDKTVEMPASQLYLPADLPAGFYNVGWQAAEGGNSIGGGAIVVVAPGLVVPRLSGQLMWQRLAGA